MHRTGILTIFRSYFGRNDDFLNSFWNLLTFSNQRPFHGKNGFTSIPTKIREDSNMIKSYFLIIWEGRGQVLVTKDLFKKKALLLFLQKSGRIQNMIKGLLKEKVLPLFLPKSGEGFKECLKNTFISRYSRLWNKRRAGNKRRA